MTPTLLALLATGSLLPPAAAAAAVSPELLRELEQRLTQPPPCCPNCASVEQAIITTTDTTLTVDLTVHSGALLGLPLPTSTTWTPDRVLLNAKIFFKLLALRLDDAL